jgi:hypothetical protein
MPCVEVESASLSYWDITLRYFLAGPEHAGTATNAVQPSCCTLPMFHPPHTSNQGIGLGYVLYRNYLSNPLIPLQLRLQRRPSLLM